MSEKFYSLPIKSFEIAKPINSNSQFLHAKYYAISEGKNLNKSNFVLSGMEKCVQTNDYAGKPILGAWNKNKLSEVGLGDFGGHDSNVGYDAESGTEYNTYLGEKNERPLGFISHGSGKIELHNGKKWLTFEGDIWTKYNREAVKLLENRRSNNVSVEIEVLKSHIEDGVEIIEEFTLLGITIIGMKAGIPNACLLLEYTQTPKYNEFVRAFSEVKKEGQNVETFLSKEKFGTGKALEINLSKESASSDDWGEVDKTAIRNTLLEAENYKSLIPKSYLVVEQGWEDAPSEKLKYPIVQIKDGKVVINENGVKAATAYLEKETDRDYYPKAKAKLNKIRKMLGMERIFGVETNDDFGTTISQIQPSIIKMSKEELVAKVNSLFEIKKDAEERRKKLKEEYEDSVGDEDYVSEEEKSEFQAKCEQLQKDIASYESKILECDKEITVYAKFLAEKDGEKKDTDEDLEDDEADDDDEEYVEHCEAKGFTYISHSKNYIVYSKEEEIFVSKYEKKDNSIIFEENDYKVKKVVASFVVGGLGSVIDVVGRPAKVEIVNGYGRLFKEIKLAKEKEKEFENKISEAQSNFNKLEKESKEKEELFTKKTLEQILKFEEIVTKEDVTVEYKKDIFNKIFKNDFSNSEDLETKVYSYLYKNNKNKGVYLNGSFLPLNANTNFEQTESERLKAELKKYKLTK